MWKHSANFLISWEIFRRLNTKIVDISSPIEFLKEQKDITKRHVLLFYFAWWIGISFK